VLCLACHRFTEQSVCANCRRLLRPASERVLAGGVRLIAGFEHTGPARVLVHQLKYRGITGYADLIASILGPRLPRLSLVPIPRAWSRRARFGVDPALVLAQSLAKVARVPVRSALSPPIHTPKRAGGDHRRPVLPFRLRAMPESPIVLVDDVVTTGATLEMAIGVLGAERVALAVAANAAPAVSSLPSQSPGPR
jgi:predicted amidophosphoribosyltransferase